MKIILNHAVQERRVILAPGTELEKDDAEAQSMIARGVARAVPSESPAAAEPPTDEPPTGSADRAADDDGEPVVLSDDEVAEFVKLNKDAALGVIENIPPADKGMLRALFDVEQTHKKRADVLAAIGAKLFPPVTD